MNENIDNKFADFPDNRRYFKGELVKILGDKSSPKKIWIKTKNGEKEEVEMNQLSMTSSDDSDRLEENTTDFFAELKGGIDFLTKHEDDLDSKTKETLKSAKTLMKIYKQTKRFTPVQTKWIEQNINNLFK